MSYISLTINYFKRNNIAEQIVLEMLQSAYNLVTLKSRLKILKYRFMLERQKLENIETTLATFGSTEVQGLKINRRY